MSYDLSYTDDALEDIGLLKRNEPSAFKKLSKLLDELIEHPETGTGNPQLKEEVLGYVMSGSGIRRLPTAEFETEIRRSVTAELQMVSKTANDEWKLAAEKLFNRLSSTHLKSISQIDNPTKRVFYELEAIRGCWSFRELERQIDSLYYERSGLSKNKEALSALVQQ